jgi:DNA polymerase-3 subunit gamma/tau
MSYQVLARKWRPKNFESLVGQEHVVKALTHALEQKRLHHAYLFTGTRGVGKTTIARILSKSLNCETGITAEPCGKCSACLEIDAGRYVDLLEVDAATNTRVEEMRELLENAVYAPSRGRFKVYVIDEVHQLSNHAFNAMLKTLEEPPEHIKFILATTDPQKIPVTVLSRCLQFNLKQMPADAIAAHLGRVLTEERIESEPNALRLIAKGAHGSMRDALSLLDQAIAYAGGTVSDAAVRSMLGTIDQTYLFDIVEAVSRGDAAAALAVADGMLSRSVSFDGALQDLAALLQRVALAQASPGAVPETEGDRPRVIALAAAIDPEEVQLYYQIAIHARQDLPLAPDDYAGFTMGLLRMLAFRPGTQQTGRPVPSKPAIPVASSANPQNARPGIQTAARPVSQAASQPGVPKRVESAAPGIGGPKTSFDGDWPALVRTLDIGGLARQLAQKSELKGFGDGLFSFRLPATFRHLTEKSYQEKLRGALEEHLGEPVRLAFELGETGGNTVQDRAVAAISQDGFVRELMENFDATIVDSSIKPTQ